MGDFCGRLGNRTLMFIGDSTMAQAMSTLASYVFFGRGGCQTQIIFGQSDTLIHKWLGKVIDHKPRGYNRGFYWTDWVYRYKPDIVIVNAGPHVHQKGSFEMVLNTVLHDYLNGTRDFKLVWKTN